MKTANQTQAKKLAIIDNSIAFLSPIERFAKKLIKTAGNEPARLCHPHAYVSNGFLHVVASDTKATQKNVPANAPLAVRRPRAPLVAI